LEEDAGVAVRAMELQACFEGAEVVYASSYVRRSVEEVVADGIIQLHR
jgi:hypothetical protein